MRSLHLQASCDVYACQDHDATTAVADDEWIKVAEENMRKALALARAALDAAEAILGL